MKRSLIEKIVREELKKKLQENVMDAEDLGWEVKRLQNIITRMVEKGAESDMSALGELNSELKSLSDKIERLENSLDPVGAAERERGRQMAMRDDEF